jgi:hypothetical protein
VVSNPVKFIIFPDLKLFFHGTVSDLFAVKQEIARLGILPFSEFWAKSTRYGTPGPALFLHWIFSTILIIICPLDSPNGYLVISTLFNYCRTLVGGEQCQTTII